MALINADVHLHTCLSPCAEITQSPKRVVERAYKKGLDLIFITDHNSAANAAAAIRAAGKYGTLSVYPGMEITTREEVHVLALFGKIVNAVKMQDEISIKLPDAFSEKEQHSQILADENDVVTGYYKKSLLSAVDLSINEIIEMIHDNNGIAAAAHFDRQSFSVLSQLGFIPGGCMFDALEVSPNISIESAAVTYSEYAGRYKFVKGSDAHSLNMIGSALTEYYGDNTFESFLGYLNE